MQSVHNGQPLKPRQEQRFRWFSAARCIHLAARRRLEIEARILANQAAADIATAMAVDRQVVSAYEDYFFDLRDVLSAYLFVGAWVFDDPELADDHLRLYVLRQAYHGGIYVAETLLTRIDVLGQDHDLATTEGQLREHIEIGVLSMMLQHELPTNQSARTGHALQSISNPPRVTPTIADVIHRRLIAAVQQLAADIEEEEQRQALRTDVADTAADANIA